MGEIQCRGKSFLCLVILLGLPLSLTGCAGRQYGEVMAKAPERMEGVIFAADGAGDFRISSSHLRKVLHEEHIPLHVVPFLWSHGYLRILSDQMDSGHVREQARRLAVQVESFHRDFPGVPITLWGHSAGSAVVMASLEELPPGIVQRAILLSPSLSSRYDVRPALRNLSEGLYVYYSRQDWVYLGVATCLLDPGEFAATSGRVGFRIPEHYPEDELLYRKLYQRPWHKRDKSTGNLGGHYGNYQPEFIRRVLVPILRGQGINPADCVPDVEE